MDSCPPKRMFALLAAEPAAPLVTAPIIASSNPSQFISVADETEYPRKLPADSPL